jgi:hypothetical protein
MGNNGFNRRPSFRESTTEEKILAVKLVDPSQPLTTLRRNALGLWESGEDSQVILTKDRTVELATDRTDLRWLEVESEDGQPVRDNQLTFRVSSSVLVGPHIDFPNLPNIHSQGLWRTRVEGPKTSKALGMTFRKSRDPKWQSLPQQSVFKLGNQVIKATIIDPFEPYNFNSRMASLYDDIFHQDPTKVTDNIIGKSFMTQRIGQQMSQSIHSSQFSINARVCKICLEPENPMAEFAQECCKCAGSMNVHTKCLIATVKSRCKRINQEGVIYYSLAGARCEICCQLFKKSVRFGGKKTPLISFDFPKEGPLLMMEVYEVGARDIKNLIFWPRSGCLKDVIGLGKGQGNALRFRDDSVANFHAQLRWNKGGVELMTFSLDNPVYFRVEGSAIAESVEGDLLEHSGKLFSLAVITQQQFTDAKKKLRGPLILNPVSPKEPRSYGPVLNALKGPTVSTLPSSRQIHSHEQDSRSHLLHRLQHLSFRAPRDVTDSIIMPEVVDNSVGIERLLHQMNEENSENIQHSNLPNSFSLIPFARAPTLGPNPTPKTAHTQFSFASSFKKYPSPVSRADLMRDLGSQRAPDTPTPFLKDPNHVPITIRNEPWFEDSDDQWSISHLDAPIDQSMSTHQIAFKFN